MRFLNTIGEPVIQSTIVACLILGQVHASGFALIENGASGQGNAYAGRQHTRLMHQPFSLIPPV